MERQDIHRQTEWAVNPPLPQNTHTNTRSAWAQSNIHARAITHTEGRAHTLSLHISAKKLELYFKTFSVVFNTPRSKQCVSA